MSDKMLIDASHQEETRVVVTRGNRIEEFDFESEHKKQLKGNIYLARVTRVEPSLQAAFVEYGGNRHGFLAFAEIHPDYYQIPVADRQALLEDEARGLRERDLEQDARDETTIAQDPSATLAKTKNRAVKMAPIQIQEEAEDSTQAGAVGNIVDDMTDDAADGETDTGQDIHGASDNDTGDNGDGDDMVELVGAEDAMEEVPLHQHDHRRSYKIQEVIKKRQILLVQVVKEERGNKGAALTTYLSLAGRYSVLMPNTARGGGISRKIINLHDRNRLKDIVKELEVPKGMGVILRTAGANRTRTEIKRDYEYLMRLWENVRNLTLSSIAPALVHEEGNLIKRSIRDLYNKDIGEILVAGEQGYREAKDFMRMLMPSHAKVVQPYRDPMPIFSRNGIESQLDRMLQPEVNLKSGGYLVLNQTEALVAIDVNSGRSTREHSVEETALRTNLEAAEEVARQLRLRDLAGLVVIDFIDMAEKRNIKAVEKKLKDCLKGDRARIQVGHISAFGLLEMSRQRLRASVLESTTQICPHCHGTGYIRSPSSVALHVIRGIEEYLLRHNAHDLIVHTPTQTALYVLNHKRRLLSDLEARFGLEISIEADDNLGTQHFVIHQGDVKKGESSLALPVFPLILDEEEDESAARALEAEIAAEKAADPQETQEMEADNQRHRRDKRRRGNRHRGNGFDVASQDTQTDVREQEKSSPDDLAEDIRDKRRRRGRRAGRKIRDLNGRGRLPFAEPVGPFAASALAALRHRRRTRSAPRAEPVGPFFVTGNLFVKDDLSNTPTDNFIPQTTQDEAMAVVETSISNDMAVTQAVPAEEVAAVKSGRGRKAKAKQAAEAMPISKIVEDKISTLPEETLPAKTPRTRRTKGEKTLSPTATELAGTQISSPDTQPPVLEEKPKKRKAATKKSKNAGLEENPLPADQAAAMEEVVLGQSQPLSREKPKSGRSRHKKQPEESLDIQVESSVQPAFVGITPVGATQIVISSAETLQQEQQSTEAQQQEALTDPLQQSVVTSSSTQTAQKSKRVGWWQRKSFF